MTGQLSVEEASRYRRAVLTARALESAAIRYTSAGTLRKAGFAVVHTPRRVTNGCEAPLEHVSVIWPADDPISRQDIPWPRDVSECFAKCFDGYK